MMLIGFISKVLICIYFITIPQIGIADNKKSVSLKKQCSKNKTLRRSKKSLCDWDKDGIANNKEKRYKTNYLKWDTDGDFLSDGHEIKKFHTNPRSQDSDRDGIVDGNDDANGNGISDEDEDDKKNEGPKKEDLDDPKDKNSQCSDTPSPFDGAGATSSFGIPSGLLGTISKGQIQFTQSCSKCHSSDKGTNFTYSRLSTAVSGAPMFITNLSEQSLSDLVAYLNRTNIPPSSGQPCVTPTQSPVGDDDQDEHPPTPTPLSTQVPLATQTPAAGSCTPIPNPFDSQGNTSSFGIPQGVVGNTITGEGKFTTTCKGCHGMDRGTNYPYQQLSTAIAGAPMFITSLSQQEISHLVAYLNRFNIPPTPRPDCNPQMTPTPSPTPTPLDDISKGRLVYVGSCSACHSSARSLRGINRREYNEAIAEVDEMRSIILTEEQIRVLIIYLRSL